MYNLIWTELLKLKRAKMFLVSLVGASAAPIMMFIGFRGVLNERVTFEVSFYNTNLYVIVLIGVLLYGIITSFLFHREYTEDTLKSLLTIPVSRVSLILSKMVMLFIWILVLTLTAWGLTLILGLIGGFEDLSAELLLRTLIQYIVGGTLLFLLSTPTIFITLIYKNYMPTMIFSAIITMGNVALANSKHRVLFPWSAAHSIANQEFVPDYPPLYSYVSVLATAVLGLAAVLIYFKRTDIDS
ncbi:ABC transporter permease [Paenibacillus sp. J22TS3]|uniref:ABC transporter permease n=1 Tax=Paenibacillus sp. J22TS3 TaxID=2807192 RepID=UPI001B281E7F|nr:ABC transporter permease [Paenibacillus sp. J22TS3]GIP22071.1 bacitracin ABC transporter permease [Paenibacillus sp. J22TS3]